MPDLHTRLHDALAGRYTIERELGRGGKALEQAISHYERAVALDSSFARPWGRLSQAQSSRFRDQANRAAAEAA